MLLNRQRELTYLNNRYARRGADLAVLYRRRRPCAQRYRSLPPHVPGGKATLPRRPADRWRGVAFLATRSGP